VWKELDTMIRDYLDNVKLDQFIRNTPESEGKVPDDKNWNCGL
jgi:Rrf2 family iron-sulfur cluster assembly transcriptional regulator